MPEHSTRTVNALASATDDGTDPIPSAAFQGAAPRLLCVCEREPSWVLLTVGLNAVGLAPPRLVWVSSPRAALSRLREEQFDCLVVVARAIKFELTDVPTITRIVARCEGMDAFQRARPLQQLGAPA